LRTVSYVGVHLSWRGANIAAKTDTQTDADAKTDSHTNADTHSGADANSNSDSNSNSDANTRPDANSDSIFHGRCLLRCIIGWFDCELLDRQSACIG